MNDNIPLILDTDIGSDIDDAVCLSYLLGQPRCDLLGITTVTGRDPRVRASLADAVCRAAGRTDIPIHSGASAGIRDGETVQPEVPQAAILDRFPHRKPGEFPSNTAVQWLHRTISERPGEITLLGIGPMTNLGLLFALDPEIPRKLKRLVLMCGVFTNALPWIGPREWNAFHDPLATHIVYRSPVALHQSVGLDVTTQVQMPTDVCIDRFNAIGGPLAVVAAMTGIWRQHVPTVTFHDPLAATSIFRDGILDWQPAAVSVELASQPLSGMTHCDRNAAVRPHQVALGVDAPGFFEEFFTTVSRLSPAGR